MYSIVCAPGGIPWEVCCFNIVRWILSITRCVVFVRWHKSCLSTVMTNDVTKLYVVMTSLVAMLCSTTSIGCYAVGAVQRAGESRRRLGETRSAWEHCELTAGRQGGAKRRDQLAQVRETLADSRDLSRTGRCYLHGRGMVIIHFLNIFNYCIQQLCKITCVYIDIVNFYSTGRNITIYRRA